MACIHAAKLRWPGVSTVRPAKLNEIYKFLQVRQCETSEHLNQITGREQRPTGTQRKAFERGEATPWAGNQKKNHPSDNDAANDLWAAVERSEAKVTKRRD